MLLRDALKHATRVEHEQLEARLALTDEDLPLERYIDYLRCMLTFYRVAERELVAAASVWPPIVTCTGKLRWLEDDLAHFGQAPAMCEVRPELLPALTRIPEAIGTSYVLEGATLGGLVLYAHCRKRFGIERHRGGSFLFGYGSQTAARWKAFVRNINDSRLAAAEVELCIDAARQTFGALDAWFAANGWSHHADSLNDVRS